MFINYPSNFEYSYMYPLHIIINNSIKNKIIYICLKCVCVCVYIYILNDKMVSIIHIYLFYVNIKMCISYSIKQI